MLWTWLRNRRASRPGTTDNAPDPQRWPRGTACLRLERLEDRIVPNNTIPAPIAALIAGKIESLVPQLISGSLTNVSGIPVLGTALAKSLTTGMLGQALADGVANAITDPTGAHYQDDGNLPATVLVDPVKASATETVPFNLPLGSFLTLTSTPLVTVNVTIYYAAAFQYGLTSATIFDGHLNNYAAQLGVTLPDASMAVVETVTLPAGFSASGLVNGQLPVTFTDHGGATPTSYSGTIGIKLGTFDAATGTPTPTGDLNGAAHLDLDANIQFAAPGQSGGLPFNPAFSAELVGDWLFNDTDVLSSPAAPKGDLTNLELRNVQADSASLSAMAGVLVDKVQSVLGQSTVRKLINTFETKLPLVGSTVAQLADSLGLISDSTNNFLSALVALDNLQVPATPPAGPPISLGSYQISDPRPGNFSLTPEGDVPPQNAPDLVTALNQALGIATGSAADVGFSFPLLTDPADVFPQLLHLGLGDPTTDDVTLAAFHLPSIDLDLGPGNSPGLQDLAVGSISFQGDVHIHLQLDMGYDTYGLRELNTDPTHNPADLLDGFYAIKSSTQDPTQPNTLITAQGDLTLSGGVGVFAQGGLFAVVQLQPDGTPDPLTNKVRIAAFLDMPGCLFTGHGSIYVEAEIGVGASIPGIGALGPSVTIGHDDLFVFQPDCVALTGNVILPTADQHTIFLPQGATVSTFDRQLLSDTDTDLYSGILVTQTNGETDFYVERDVDGKVPDDGAYYYDAIVTQGSLPDQTHIEITNPFGEAVLPAGDVPRIALVGGPGDDEFVYLDNPSVKVEPTVLFVGGDGNNRLEGADLAFGGYVPTSWAAQAQALLPASNPHLLDAVISDNATAGDDTLIGTRSGIMVGGGAANAFDETGGGSFQFYGGTGMNTYTIRPSVNGQRATYVIEGAGGPANNLLTVIQGDDPTVTAASLSIDVQAATVPDDTNPAKKALAVDDGTQPPFATANGVGSVSVDPVSAATPVTTGIGKLTGTTVQNVVYLTPKTPGRVGDTLRVLGTASADTFKVDEVNIPNLDPIPGYFFDGGYTDLDSDPRPVAEQVSVTYGDDQTSATITLPNMQAADHLALAGERGHDSYTVYLAAGTYYTTDIEDSSLTDGSDLNILGVEGNFVRQDKITVNDNSAQFEYHLAQRASLHNWDFNGIAINSLDDFRNNYHPLIDGEIVTDVSDPVDYAPAVTWGDGVGTVGIHAYGTFGQVTVNRPVAPDAVTLTMEPSAISAGEVVASQEAAYSDAFFPPPSAIQPVQLLDPRAVVNVQANAGQFTFDDRVGGSTINVRKNAGVFTLAGTTTSPAASAVVAADVAAGAPLNETVNILANTGTINLDHTGVGLAAYDYADHPDQINVGGGNLAGLTGQVSLMTSADLAAVAIDDSNDPNAGTTWTFDATGVHSPLLGFGYTPSSSLGLLSLKVNAGSPVVVAATPAVAWTASAPDQNNTLQGPDGSNQWQIKGPDSGVLNSTLTYTGFNNLTGGKLDDTFSFVAGGSVSGTLDGGPGPDALDYLGYTPPPVHVDLKAGQATAVGGAVENVEAAFLFSLSPINNLPSIQEGVTIPGVQVPVNNPGSAQSLGTHEDKHPPKQ